MPSAAFSSGLNSYPERAERVGASAAGGGGTTRVRIQPPVPVRGGIHTGRIKVRETVTSRGTKQKTKNKKIGEIMTRLVCLQKKPQKNTVPREPNRDYPGEIVKTQSTCV